MFSQWCCRSLYMTTTACQVASSPRRARSTPSFENLGSLRAPPYAGGPNGRRSSTCPQGPRWRSAFWVQEMRRIHLSSCSIIKVSRWSMIYWSSFIITRNVIGSWSTAALGCISYIAAMEEHCLSGMNGWGGGPFVSADRLCTWSPLIVSISIYRLTWLSGDNQNPINSVWDDNNALMSIAL